MWSEDAGVSQDPFQDSERFFLQLYICVRLNLFPTLWPNNQSQLAGCKKQIRERNCLHLSETEGIAKEAKQCHSSNFFFVSEKTVIFPKMFMLLCFCLAIYVIG